MIDKKTEKQFDECDEYALHDWWDETLEPKEKNKTQGKSKF